MEKQTKKGTQSVSVNKKHVYEGQTCPMCGSHEFSEGAAGGRCYECGYYYGFHGTGETHLPDKDQE